MATLRELEAKFKKHRPENRELEALYCQREAEVAMLGKKTAITVKDLAPLDRLGRFQVADTLWTGCDPEARQALLHDEHHHVRSAATLASMA